MSKDLNIQIVLSALDLATKDIEGVNAKVKELQETLSKGEYKAAASAMGAFGQAVAQSTAPMAEATTKALALSGAIAAIATAVTAKVYQSAVDYEAATADLAKVLDGGREEALAYGEQLDQLALQYASNGQAMLSAMANFKQAGFTAGEAFQLVEQSTKLMIAGDIEAAESAERLVAILKGFAAPATEAARVVDLLNEVSNKYATDVAKLSVGMAGLSPIAKTMGFSMEETAALVTPVIEVYRSGAEAADALKVSLTKLTDDTKPVIEALDQLGVAQRDANGNLRSGREIFLDVARAMSTLDDNTRGFLTQQLVGIEQAGRFGVVLRDTARFAEITGVALGATGSAAREVATRLEIAQAASKRTAESFRQLSVTLGNTLKTEIAGVVSATGALAAAFDQSVKAGDLNPLLAALRPQVDAIERLLQGIADHLETALAGVDWTPLVDGLRDLSAEMGGAFAALFDDMDLRTADGLREFLQRVVNLLGDFSRYIAGVISGLEPFLDTLNAVFFALSDGYPALARFIGELQGLATSANLVVPALASIGSAVFGVIGTIAEFAFKVGLAIIALKLLSAAGLPVGAIFGTLASAIAKLLPTLALVVGRLTGLTAAIRLIGPAAAAVGAYQLGQTLRDWGLDAGYAAEQGTLAAKAFELMATEAEKAERHLADTADAITGKLAAISETTGLNITNMREFNRLADDGRIVYDQTTQAWRVATTAVEDYTAANQALLAASEQELAITEALRLAFGGVGQSYDSLTDKAEALEEAFQTLGVDSQESLDATAAKARAAFDVIATGAVPIQRLQAAWDAYAKTAIAANNGVIPAALRTEAAQRGLTIAAAGTAAALANVAQAQANYRAELEASRAPQTEGERMMAAYQAEAAKEAEVIAKANEAKKASWEEVNRAHITYSDQTQQAAEQEKTAAEQVIDQLEQIDQIDPSIDITDNVPEVLDRLASLEGRDTSSTHTIYIKEVQAANAGGYILRRANGGTVFQPLRGSRVPGSGNTDSVPAALPAGSFVVRKSAAGRYAPLINTLLTPGERIIPPEIVAGLGLGFWRRLNAQRLNSGGMVGANATAATDTVNIKLSIGARTVQLQSARGQAQSLAAALRELQRTA